MAFVDDPVTDRRDNVPDISAIIQKRGRTQYTKMQSDD